MIDAWAMADNGYRPGIDNLITRVEVAVPRAFAREAAHSLRVEPPGEEVVESPRVRRAGLAAVAVMVIICLLLLAGFVLLPRPFPR